MGLTAAGHQTLTVSSTAVALTVPTPTDRTVDEVTGIVSGADIVFKSNGDTPTSSDGDLLRDGDRFRIRGHTDINNFKAIRIASTDATVYLSYWVEEN
tara:strand:- start:506 stop:799 length:294 start_codon:yes stop_codon:yes gene_type:complete